MQKTNVKNVFGKTLIATVIMSASIAQASEPKSEVSILDKVVGMISMPTKSEASAEVGVKNTKAELERLQVERENLLKAQEQLRKQEQDMAQKLAALKEQQKKEMKEILSKKAEAFRAQQIKEYEKGITDIQARIEKTKKDIADQEAAINTRIEEANLLYQSQVNEIEEANRQIAENERKLNLLREQQQKRLATIQETHKKELAELKKQQAQLLKEGKGKTSREVMELERQARILSAKMTNLSKTDTAKIIQDNIQVLGQGLDIRDLDLNITPTQQPKEEVVEQEPVPTQPEVENSIEFSEPDSLQINQKENEKLPNVTEWVQTQIKRHKGMYQPYGTWLEVKQSNKI